MLVKKSCWSGTFLRYFRFCVRDFWTWKIIGTYGINNKIIPHIYTILYCILGHFHVISLNKYNDIVTLIVCYSVMFPNRQKNTNENISVVLISPSSESNTVSDIRRDSLIEWNKIYLLVHGASSWSKSQMWAFWPQDRVCFSTLLAS